MDKVESNLELKFQIDIFVCMFVSRIFLKLCVIRGMPAGARFLAGFDLVLVAQSRKRCANTGQNWFGVSCLLGTTDDNHNGLLLNHQLLFVLFVTMNNSYTCMNVLICGL